MSEWGDRVFEAMTTKKIQGVSLNDLVGGGPARKVGEENVAIVESFGRLDAEAKVLEIGCGCGRVAAVLAERGNCADYYGQDIIPGLVNFCSEHIGTRLPRFRFSCIDQSNALYDQYRHSSRNLDTTDYLKSDNYFDTIFAFSVFTHLPQKEAGEMLKLIHQRLAVGGTAVLTAFVMTRLSLKNCQSRVSNQFTSIADLDENLVINDKSGGENSAVAFPFPALEEMVMNAGFDGIHSIQFGAWRNAPGRAYQDVIVLKKRADLPVDFSPGHYLDLNPDVKASGMNPYFHFRAYGQDEGRRWK